MKTSAVLRQRVCEAVRVERLVDTARQLIAVPSPTGAAGGALDCLARLLEEAGFAVARPDGGYPQAPAVAVRWPGESPGRVLQFDGHLDTVHLPFVPPALDGDTLRGSGSADMKAGTAAAVEALFALRDADALATGQILLTAHDLHEAPWGDGRQLDALIREGWVGDAVLIPEYLADVLPVIGRGALTWKATIARRGPPVHEVMRPEEPSVIAAGAELVQRLAALDRELRERPDPVAGSASVFVGQIHAGEIYNQYPQVSILEGTRRWLPGTRRADVAEGLQALVADVARLTGTTIALDVFPIRDAFLLEPNHPFVGCFESVYQDFVGQALPRGAKAFCDDGNTFWSLAQVPAITHGPQAGGAHTLQEWVSVTDLVRVARLYALTALEFC